MKSDQIQRRSKERGRETEGADFRLGENWAIADLKAYNFGGAIPGNKELLAFCLKELSASPVAARMIDEAAQHGWSLGLAPLEQHDFHLDVPEKKILLGNQEMDGATIARAFYFLNALHISLIRALRDVWQERRHGGFDVDYAPESVLFLERIRAADCDVVSALVAWELKAAGNDSLWKHMSGSDESDIIQAFSCSIEKNNGSVHKALAAAFRQWFRNILRVNGCDHEALEYMDDVLRMHPGVGAFGRKRAGRNCVELLSCLPDKTAYLRGQGDEILRDPVYSGLNDPFNQNHFMHIIRDSEVILIQNVPFRDAALAYKIFPNGEITAERENVKQKS